MAMFQELREILKQLYKLEVNTMAPQPEMLINQIIIKRYIS